VIVQSLIDEADVQRALGLDSETPAVDFKSAFAPADKGEFLEVLKDLVAMANSGGGIILFGITNDGKPADADLTGVAALDPARITDAIYKYTDCQFQHFEIRRLCKCGHDVWGLIIG
jgi:hypothetical protein